MRIILTLLVVLTACVSAVAEPSHVIVADTDRRQIAREVASLVLVDTEAHQGSGFVVARDRGAILVVTCLHVVEGQQSIWLHDHLGWKARAHVEEVDESADLALLYTLERMDARAAPIALRDPQPFDPVDVLGYPAGALSVSTGRVTTVSWFKYGISGAVIAHGISGGPVYDATGAAVGVVSEVEVDSQETEIHGLGKCVSRRMLVALIGRYLTTPRMEVGR